MLPPVMPQSVPQGYYTPMQEYDGLSSPDAGNGHDLSRAACSDESTSFQGEDDEAEHDLLDRLMDESDPLNNKFQMTTAAVILTCTVTMAVETDYYPDCSLWWWWNTAVLIYFCLELGVRIWHAKLHFFACCDGNKECFWNYFDFTIVVICIITQWVEPLLSSNDDGNNGLDILRIFRVFRILRTLRVLRIFRACTQLNNLAVGLLDSIGTVFWIALLMLMFMLIFAIVLTDVAGNQAKKATKPGDLFYDVKDDIEMYWGSVGKSLVTLFQMLTLDDWTNISRQVYAELPPMWFVFFLYVFLMGFAMLSLLTGVVAEHMTEVSTETKNEQKKEDDHELMQFLDEEMVSLEQQIMTPSGPNPDGSPGSPRTGMTLQEFKIFLRYPQVQAKLAELNASLEEHEADEFWDCLDRNFDGTLTHQELKAGFLRLRGELQPKDMLRIRYAAERVTRCLQGGQGEAATTRKLEEINSSLSVVEEKLKSMQTKLRGFMTFVQDKESPNSMRAITKRVSGACL